MTKEELEKEAGKWLRKYLLCCNCEKKCNCIDSNSYCEEQVLKAYVDGAEPREKRIEELEQENERLKGDLELWESGACRATNLDKCGVVKELKAQIEKMKCCGNCTKGNCVNIGQKGRACAYWTSNELKEMKEND